MIVAILGDASTHIELLPTRRNAFAGLRECPLKTCRNSHFAIGRALAFAISDARSPEPRIGSIMSAPLLAPPKVRLCISLPEPSCMVVAKILPPGTPARLVVTLGSIFGQLMLATVPPLN